MLGFRKFLIAKKCMDKKRGGSINTFLQNFLSHSDKNFRRGTPLGVTDFGYPKILCLRGLCHNFSKNFLSHSAEKCRRGFLLSFINLGYRKSLDEMVVGGEYQDFPSKFSCLTEPKHFVEKPFCAGFQKFYDSKKVYG